MPGGLWRLVWLSAVVVSVLGVSGCGRFGGDSPTRTPVPTYTPTPLGAEPASAEGADATGGDSASDSTPMQVAMPSATNTVTPIPPTPTSTPTPSATPTPEPTSTPSPTPSLTPTVTPTPPPTDTPMPTPTPNYFFDLETAEKHPTNSLAPNVVRVYLYVYEPGGLALEGYTLQVLHNGTALPVESVSTGGLPDVTRSEPGPYTRFTNMNAIFVEAQAGAWTVQLLNQQGTPVGPPAEFELTVDEATRELYVRYRMRE